MAKFLLIESRDPFESNEVQKYYDLAIRLVEHGNEVTLFLTQNGVLPARRDASNNGLLSVAKTKVNILADDFSLRERGILSSELLKDVSNAPLGYVVTELAEGQKTLWH